MDTLIRRKKQRALVSELVERKIRTRAQEIYDARGRAEGLALEDWIQAESEVLGQSPIAMLARRSRAEKGELVECS